MRRRRQGLPVPRLRGQIGDQPAGALEALGDVIELPAARQEGLAVPAGTPAAVIDKLTVPLV